MVKKKKQKEHVSMDSVYGNKCLLHVANIALFGILMILAIGSICVYYLMPVVDVTRLPKITDVLDVGKTIPVLESDDTEPDSKNLLEDGFYDIVATRNVFSPQRKDWVVKAVIPKASELKKKIIQNKKKAFAGKPKKFVLHGILIAGDIKKALINNPLKGVRKKKTLYVEEGQDLDGYKVKSIEKDRIRLDWNGEEIVVLLYSGVKDNAPLQNRQNEIKKPRKRMKRLKVNKSDISIKKQNEAEKSLVASEVDTRKATIDNPITGIDKKQTLYVAEGEDIDVFRVASFKKDRIGLDWQGEERVATLYSIINDYKQKDYAEEEINKTIETIYVDDGYISAKDNNKEVDGSSAVTEIDDENRKTCKRIISSVFYEESLVPMSMSYESLYMAVIEDKKMSLLNNKQEIDETSHEINVANIDNSGEEHKFTKVEVSVPLDIDPEEGFNGKLVSKGPTIINLHGIFIVDGIGKAMIDIPFNGIEKKQTLYIAEGDDLDGCRVARIYKDGIRLNCQGEERLVTLNSTIQDYKQKDYVAEGSNKTMEIIEVDKEYASEKDNLEVDVSLLVAAVDDEGREEGSRIINVFEDEPFNLMSMAYESLFMPTMNDVKISVPDEIKEVAETLPDLEVVGIDYSEEEQKLAMVQPVDSVYKVLEEGELKQKELLNVPTQIILKGIVIAGNIKKALVNVPMSKVSANRTLYVEEGDGFEGYMVTEIEPVQIRLDWQGEEMIVTFSDLY